jgi:hypothetical protein
MSESNVWEPLAAACVVDMVKQADENQAFVEFPPVIISRLRRLLEDSEYRAVAFDTWKDNFVGDKPMPTTEMLKELVSSIKELKRIQ